MTWMLQSGHFNKTKLGKENIHSKPKEKGKDLNCLVCDYIAEKILMISCFTESLIIQDAEALIYICLDFQTS
jgi:hypothetical protein